jgi:small subunit ribosomal protein S16
MALKIRLRQQGCSNRQTFRVVVTDIRSKRDGKYIEKLGWYLPEQVENNCSIDADRLSYWLSQGALMTEQVERLAKVVTPSVLQEYKAKKAELRVKRTAKRRKLAAPVTTKEVNEKPAAAKKSVKKTTKKA